MHNCLFIVRQLKERFAIVGCLLRSYAGGRVDLTHNVVLSVDLADETAFV